MVHRENAGTAPRNLDRRRCTSWSAAYTLHHHRCCCPCLCRRHGCCRLAAQGTKCREHRVEIFWHDHLLLAVGDFVPRVLQLTNSTYVGDSCHLAERLAAVCRNSVLPEIKFLDTPVVSITTHSSQRTSLCSASCLCRCVASSKPQFGFPGAREKKGPCWTNSRASPTGMPASCNPCCEPTVFVDHFPTHPVRRFRKGKICALALLPLHDRLFNTRGKPLILPLAKCIIDDQHAPKMRWNVAGLPKLTWL